MDFRNHPQNMSIKSENRKLYNLVLLSDLVDNLMLRWLGSKKRGFGWTGLAVKKNRIVHRFLVR